MIENQEPPQPSPKVDQHKLRKALEGFPGIAFDRILRAAQSYLDERSGAMLRRFVLLRDALKDITPDDCEVLGSFHERKMPDRDGIHQTMAFPKLNDPESEWIAPPPNHVETGRQRISLQCRVKEAVRHFKKQHSGEESQRRLCTRLIRICGLDEVPFQYPDHAGRTRAEHLLVAVMECVPKKCQFGLDHARNRGWLTDAHSQVRHASIQTGIRALARMEGLAPSSSKAEGAILEEMRQEAHQAVRDVMATPINRRRGRPKEK